MSTQPKHRTCALHRPSHHYRPTKLTHTCARASPPPPRLRLARLVLAGDVEQHRQIIAKLDGVRRRAADVGQRRRRVRWRGTGRVGRRRRTGDGGVGRGEVHDATLVDATLDAHVAVFTPVWAPGVADQPEGRASLVVGAVARHEHGVVDVPFTARAEDASGVCHERFIGLRERDAGSEDARVGAWQMCSRAGIPARVGVGGAGDERALGWLGVGG